MGADGCAKATWLIASINMTEKKNTESRRGSTALSFHLISSKIKAVLGKVENITATHNLLSNVMHVKSKLSGNALVILIKKFDF